MNRYLIGLLITSGLVVAGYTFSRKLDDKKLNRGATAVAVVQGSGQASPATKKTFGMDNDTERTLDVAQQKEMQRLQELDALSLDYAHIFTSAPNHKDLHDRLRHEGRDEYWASRSEELLNAEFMQIAKQNNFKDDIAIHCGTTICEISSNLDTFPKDSGERLSDDIQSPELAAKLRGKGYHDMGSAFGPSKTHENAFIIFYQREAPANVKVGRNI